MTDGTIRETRWPLISVLMPSYNHDQYIEEALQSIWAQDYPNLEIVAIDDASTDGTRERLAAIATRSPVPMTVRYHERNAGVRQTVNEAITMAHGELIQFFASDDKLVSRSLRRRAELFLNNPEIKLVFANGRVMDAAGNLGHQVHEEYVKTLLAKPAGEILEYLYTHVSPLALQGALIRRDFLLECGADKEDCLADDWVTNIRMFERLPATHRVPFLDEDVFYYRLHNDNVHRNRERQIALIKQTINTYTPQRFKRVAKANIYWHIGLSLPRSQRLRAIGYLVGSQLLAPRLGSLAGLCWEVIRNATRRRSKVLER